MKKNIITILYVFFVSFCAFCFEENGMASWYGPDFHGKLTANGEIFNTYAYTAAHKTLPFGSIVKVISDDNKETIVRINDRGPFAKNRIIDLSKSAASDIGMLKSGTKNVKIILLEKGDNKYYRENSKTYKVQIASFTDESKALLLSEKLKEIIKGIHVKKVTLDKTYFRVISDKLSYYDLQISRVALHQQNLSNYIVIKN